MPDAFSGVERAEALQRTNTVRRGRRYLSEWAKTLIIAFGLFFLLRAFLIEAFKIPSGSMERTLLVGDFLLVDKLVYGAEVPLTHLRLPALRDPKRGEVVVFEYPVNPTQNFVKRLVGLPGDTLAMTDGVLLLNGVPLDEPYVTHSAPDLDPVDQEFGWQQRYIVHAAEPRSGYHPSRNNWGPLIVPPKNYFVLGDNRDNSLDSRYWGFVPDSLLKGRPLVVYFSYAPDTTARFSWLTRVRWRRLGERIR
jgi:signal peptidase I